MRSLSVTKARAAAVCRRCSTPARPSAPTRRDVYKRQAADPVAVDFIAYCMSTDGQALATEEGYIGDVGADYTSTPVSYTHLDVYKRQNLYSE